MKTGALKLVIGLLILAFLFLKFDAGKILAEIAGSDPLYLALALAITPLTMHIRALRLQMLLAIHNENVPLKTLNELGYVGFLFGLVTPSRAGEFIRAYYISKENKIPYSHSIASVFIDRVLDVIVLFLLVDVSLIYLPYMLGHEVLGDFTWILVLSTLLFFSFLILLTRPWFLNAAVEFLERMFRRIIKKDPYAKGRGLVAKEFHVTLENLKDNKKAFLPIMLVNAVLWFFVLLQAQVILMALGAEVDIVFTFLAVPFAILASLLPVTVSGIGTRDVAMVMVFSLAGVPASKAISLSLLYLFLGQIVPAAAGEYFYLKRGYSSKFT